MTRIAAAFTVLACVTLAAIADEKDKPELKLTDDEHERTRDLFGSFDDSLEFGINQGRSVRQVDDTGGRNSTLVRRATCRRETHSYSQ